MFGTVEQMRATLRDRRCKPLSWFQPGRKIQIRDKMQQYTYTLTARPGKDFPKHFNPELTPQQMLRRGVFEGKYLNDCMFEFPRQWYAAALQRGKLSPAEPRPEINEFRIKSRKSRPYWIAKGWIPITESDRDVRGWFQWYCRYWLGRRQLGVDEIQIRRWRAFRRHRAQLIRGCPRRRRRDPTCRPRQRQALLQWAYNPYP